MAWRKKVEQEWKLFFWSFQDAEQGSTWLLFSLRNERFLLAMLNAYCCIVTLHLWLRALLKVLFGALKLACACSDNHYKAFQYWVYSLRKDLRWLFNFLMWHRHTIRRWATGEPENVYRGRWGLIEGRCGWSGRWNKHIHTHTQTRGGINTRRKQDTKRKNTESWPEPWNAGHFSTCLAGVVVSSLTRRRLSSPVVFCSARIQGSFQKLDI